MENIAASNRNNVVVVAAAAVAGMQTPLSMHPLTALIHQHDRSSILRSNPLFKDDDQEIVVIVDPSENSSGSGTSVLASSEASRTPRRAPSTSSGYGSSGCSGGGSHGRSTPKSFEKISSEDGDLDPPLSKSLQEDILSVLPYDFTPPSAITPSSLGLEAMRSRLQGPTAYCHEVESVLAVASRGAAGIEAIRARLQAALQALPFDFPPPGLKDEKPLPRPPSLPFCGPGVRPGDVTMMPKQSDLSMLAASALFTLDAAKGEVLARRLAKSRKRRRQCRAIVTLCFLAMLLAAVGAAELVLSRGTRMFGTILR